MGCVMRRRLCREDRWAPSGILHQRGRGSPQPGPVGAEGSGQGGRGGVKRWLTSVVCGRTGRRIGMYRMTAILSAVRSYPPRSRRVFRVHSKSRTVRGTKYVERRPGAPCLLPLSLSHILVKICLESLERS